MQRTTVMLPRELKMRAQQLARQDGVSLGDLIRQALDAWLRSPWDSPMAADEDPFFADDAVWTGDVPVDLARDHDRHLYGNET